MVGPRLYRGRRSGSRHHNINTGLQGDYLDLELKRAEAQSAKYRKNSFKEWAAGRPWRTNDATRNTEGITPAKM